MDNNSFPPRQMIQGNWACAGCGKAITELPFEPSADRDIFCRDCWSARRNDNRRDVRPRQMVQGNWTCADCGVEITELPFTPREGAPITCKACWLKRKNQS